MIHVLGSKDCNYEQQVAEAQKYDQNINYCSNTIIVPAQAMFQRLSGKFTSQALKNKEKGATTYEAAVSREGVTFSMKTEKM